MKHSSRGSRGATTMGQVFTQAKPKMWWWIPSRSSKNYLHVCRKMECQNAPSGYEGYFMLSKQSGDIGKCWIEYIIRDHQWRSLKSEAQFQAIVDAQKCNVWCASYRMYHLRWVLHYEILKTIRLVEVAIEAYKEWNHARRVQPFAEDGRMYIPI